MRDVLENTILTIKKIVAKQLMLDLNEVKDDSNLVKDLGADALDFVELTMSLEEQFGIDIAEEDVESFITVNDIIKFITNL